jgi:hypothetical protein
VPFLVRGFGGGFTRLLSRFFGSLQVRFLPFFFLIGLCADTT